MFCKLGSLSHLQNVKNTCRQPAACSLTENNTLLESVSYVLQCYQWFEIAKHMQTCITWVYSLFYDAASWTFFIKNPSIWMRRLEWLIRRLCNWLKQYNQCRFRWILHCCFSCQLCWSVTWIELWWLHPNFEKYFLNFMFCEKTLLLIQSFHSNLWL